MQNEIKFALLFGNQEVDNKNLDGVLECIYIDDNSYHIDTCNTLNTLHSCSVVSYDISENEYKKLENMFKE